MRRCLVVQVAVSVLLSGSVLGAAEPANPSEPLGAKRDWASVESSPSSAPPPDQSAEARPSEPSPGDLAPPQASAPPSKTEAPALTPPPTPSKQDDICKIDPSACPRLDLANLLKGPLAGAPAVRVLYIGDIGSKVSKQFVMPSGSADVRGELAFITSEAIVTPSRLKLGDLVLFRPSARRSFGDQLELSLGTTLLAKELTSSNDWIWQGASLGATIEPFPGYAIMLEGRGGPLLDGFGSAWSGAAGLGAKWSLDSDYRMVLSLGNLFTALDERGRMAARAWFDEVVLGAEAQYGHRKVALWVGVNYAIPIAKSGDLPNSPTPVALDPAVRVDLQVGFMLRAGKREDWDLFAYYAWIDRGEFGRPETRLPILDSGFDQQQLVLGVGHRFVPESRSSYWKD